MGRRTDGKEISTVRMESQERQTVPLRGNCRRTVPLAEYCENVGSHFVGNCPDQAPLVEQAWRIDRLERPERHVCRSRPKSSSRPALQRQARSTENQELEPRKFVWRVS